MRRHKARPTLDKVRERLTPAKSQAAESFTPDTHPTPHPGRWFTLDLKAQQVEDNQLRGGLRPHHANTTAAFRTLQQKSTVHPDDGGD